MGHTLAKDGSVSHHILVVDDELGILDSLRRIFDRAGFQVSTTDSGAEAIDIVRERDVDIVLTDIMMPKMSGIELLRAIKALKPSVEVVMMTAFGTVDKAVQCMKEGAYDFISKPLKRAIVVNAATRALERRLLMRENRVLRAAVDKLPERESLVGKSVALTETLTLAEQAAPSAASILLLGESGTGKERLARYLHHLSDRVEQPFVAINCGALPEDLLESELFGHEEGAFTGASSRRSGRFERADTGTLFLDEVGEMSAGLQVRLLRVLQEGEIERLGGEKTINVDVRIIAATNKDLQEVVASGRFREDLYYRLNVIQITLPPLRDRRGDVALLAQFFMQRFMEKNNKTIKGFSDAALHALDAYRWPGNVRELENTVERAVVLCRSHVIGHDDLPKMMHTNPQKRTSEHGEGIWVPHGSTLNEAERLIIKDTLERTKGDKKTAAHLLGIAARTIYRKLEES